MTARPSNPRHVVTTARSPRTVRRISKQSDQDKELNKAKQLINERPDQEKGYSLLLSAYKKAKNRDLELQAAMEGSLKIQTSRHAFLLQAWNTFTRHNEHWMALTVAREIGSHEKVKPDDAAKEAISLIHLEKYEDAESRLLKLHKSDKQNILILQQLLTCYGALGAANKKTKTFKKLITVSNGKWSYYDQLVSHFLEQGKNNKALKFSSLSYKHSSTDNEINTPGKPTVLNVGQYFHNSGNTFNKDNAGVDVEIINKKLSIQWPTSMHGQCNYKLYGRDEAAESIATWLGEDVRKHFLQCALPAMQADFFRVAFLATHKNSMYIDWPYRPVAPEGLINTPLLRTDKSILSTVSLKGKKPGLVNRFAYNNASNDISHYFEQILELILCNMTSRISNNVWRVTGPGTWIQAYKTLEDRENCVTMAKFHKDIATIFKTAFNKRQSAAKKDHWSKVQKEQSIFTD